MRSGVQRQRPPRSPQWPQGHGRVALLPWVPITLKCLKPKEPDFEPRSLGEHLKRSRLQHQLSQIEAAKNMAQKSLRALAGFAKALKFKFQDIEVGIDFEPEKGLADNGDLESDLTTLFVAAGNAAKAAQTVLVIFIDELQYVEEDQLGREG